MQDVQARLDTSKNIDTLTPIDVRFVKAAAAVEENIATPAVDPIVGNRILNARRCMPRQ